MYGFMYTFLRWGRGVSITRVIDTRGHSLKEAVLITSFIFKMFNH